MNQARQPKGIPVGGRYAENAHDEAGAELGSPVVTVAASDLRPGDVVDMTPLVKSYVDNSYDGVLDEEDDGQDMLGSFTVRSVTPGPGGSMTLSVAHGDTAYDWHVTPGTEVPLIARAESDPVAEQSTVIGSTPDASLVMIDTPSVGSGMTHSVGILPGGELRLGPNDLSALDAHHGYDSVTLRNVGGYSGRYGNGNLRADCEVSVGALANPREAQHFENSRAQINAYLSRHGLRLPEHVEDWGNVSVVHEIDLSHLQSTYDGAPHISTDDLSNEVRAATDESVAVSARWKLADAIRRDVFGLASAR